MSQVIHTIESKRKRKCRLLPTKEQEAKMIKFCHAARWAWNWAVTTNTARLQLKHPKLPVLNFIGLSKLFRALEPVLWPWIEKESIPKVAIYAEFDYCDKVFKRVFMSGNSHQNPPKLKNKRTSPLAFSDRVDMLYFINGCAQISCIGKVRVRFNYSKKYPPIPEGIIYKNKFGGPRIKRNVRGAWILTFTETYERQVVHPVKTVKVGIDLGVITLAAISHDGSSKCIMYRNINKDHDFVRLRESIKIAQSKRDHCKAHNGGNTNSRKFNKYADRYKTLSTRAANKIHDYIDWIVSRIFKLQPTQVVLEDLDVQKMIVSASKKKKKDPTNKMKVTAKALAMCNWGRLRRRLMEKCAEWGIQLILADKYYPSSQICSSCGCRNPNLRPEDRVYKCINQSCNLTINRDENAAINLKNYALNHINYTIIVQGI